MKARESEAGEVEDGCKCGVDKLDVAKAELCSRDRRSTKSRRCYGRNEAGHESLAVGRTASANATWLLIA